MPTTLLTYATNERNTYLQLAQAGLAAAQGALASAQAKLGSDAAAAKAKDSDIALKRGLFATTSVPSEAQILIATITQLTIERRELQATLLADQAAVSAASAALDFAQGRLKRAQAGLADAEKYLATVTAESARRSGWKLAITQTPLLTIAGAQGEASALLASTLYTQVSAKFGPTIVPAKLLEIARVRYALEQAELSAPGKAIDVAVDRLAAHATSVGGLSGAAESAGYAFRRAERDFGAFALSAKQNFDRASGLLDKLGDPSLAALTVAQIHDALDAATLSARDAAEALEKTLLDAQGPVDLAQATLDAATLAAQAKDPSASPASIAADPDVHDAQDDLNQVKPALTSAQGAFGAADQATLAKWQAVLPDEAWQLLLDFLDATALLTALKNANPVALASDMDAKEGAYGDGLSSLAASERTAAFLADSLALRQALAGAALASGPVRLFSAVRGDTN